MSPSPETVSNSTLELLEILEIINAIPDVECMRDAFDNLIYAGSLDAELSTGHYICADVDVIVDYNYGSRKIESVQVGEIFLYDADGEEMELSQKENSEIELAIIGKVYLTV